MIVAASYSRKSSKKKSTDYEKSVKDQEALNTKAASTNGWTLATEHRYQDNEISASRFTTEERPDWQRLQKELDAGNINVLILWETSRAWRKLSDWVLLVDACRDNRVLMHITSHSKTYDPTNRRDRKTLIEEGVDSEDESEKTSVRVKRAMDSNRQAGKGHSRPPYGYATVIDPQNLNGKIRVRVEEHAAIVVEVITRVAQSEPIVNIVRGLTERGIPSPSVAMGNYKHPKSKGEPLWSPSMIRRLCTNVAYLGKVDYEGTLVEAQWVPISDDPEFPELFWKASNLLKDPTRKTTIPGRAKHMLSFLASCGVCGNPVCRHSGKNGTSHYGCSTPQSCITIRMQWVDDYISELTCGRLAMSNVYEQLTAKDDRHLYATLETLKGEHQEALDLRANGKLSLMALSQEESRLLPLIRQAEEAIRPVVVPAALDTLLHGAQSDLQTIRQRWGALETPAKKDIIRTLYSSITIVRATIPGIPKTDAQIEATVKSRVIIEWVNA